MPETVALSPPPMSTSRTSDLGAHIPWAELGFNLLLVVWCCGTIWFVFQTVRGWMLIQKYFGLSSLLTDERILIASKMAARKVGLANVPPVFNSPSVSVPLSTGVFRSAIILPENFLRSTDQEELEAVLIHELAHIMRRDHWVGLIQRLTVAIYWWNPLIHRVSHHCSSLAEEICDDHVTTSLKSGEAFARLLVTMAERVVNRVDIPLAIGILPARTHELERRVIRLMQKERKVKTRLTLNQVVLVSLFGLLMAGTSVFSTVRADSRLDVQADNSESASVTSNEPDGDAANLNEDTNSVGETSSEEKTPTKEFAKQKSETSSPAEGQLTSAKSASLSQTTLRLLQENYDGTPKRLSPDGTKMAFSKGSLIIVSNLSTGLERKYEKAVGGYPEWSPDGQKIAFFDNEQQVSILTLDSGDVEKTDIRNAVPRDWSRDGRFLLVVDPRRDEKHEGLQLVNLQTGERQIVVKPYKHYITRFPRLSPDGNHVVYRDSVDDNNSDIFVRPIGSEKSIRVTSHEGEDISPIWSADGKQILFMSNRVIGRWDLLANAFLDRMPIGEPKSVLSGMGNNVSLHSYSRSGQLLFSRQDMRFHIFSTKVEPASGTILGDPEQLTNSGLRESNPNWSRNGKHISYYQQTSAFGIHLCVMNSGGGNKKTLGRVDAFRGATAWLPDNEHILYPGREIDPDNPEERLNGVYSISIRSRERKLIYQDPEFWGHMDLSPDAKHLAVMSGDSEQTELYIVDIDGKHRRQLVRSNNAIWSPKFTPDGKQIIYANVAYEKDRTTSRSSIMAVPLDGGEPREIYAHENGQDYVDTEHASWLRDGRYVFDIKFNPGRRFHYALSLDGKSAPVKLSPKKGNSFSVSPNGNRAVFDNGKHDWKLWLMSGFLLDDEVGKEIGFHNSSCALGNISEGSVAVVETASPHALSPHGSAKPTRRTQTSRTREENRTEVSLA